MVLTGAPDDIFITHYDVARSPRGRAEPHGQASLVGGALRAVGAVARISQARRPISSAPRWRGSSSPRIRLYLRMNRMDKVFIAAINGMATGGGCG